MPPPARPAAPRNYIIDSRYRGQTQQPQRELYAQNTYKPSAQFPEVKRVVPSSTYPPQQQVEEPYANIRHNYGEESEPPARPRQHPGYDYVKPYKNKQLNKGNTNLWSSLRTTMITRDKVVCRTITITPVIVTM